MYVSYIQADISFGISIEYCKVLLIKGLQN